MIEISIIIPVYNVAPYLSEALDSVINQSYRNLEIIVVARRQAAANVRSAVRGADIRVAFEVSLIAVDIILGRA